MSDGDLIGAAIAELDQLREAMLDYNAPADRSGDRWDALRVQLDAKLGIVRAFLVLKHKAEARSDAC
jgi:hypothetical protein